MQWSLRARACELGPCSGVGEIPRSLTTPFLCRVPISGFLQSPLLRFALGDGRRGDGGEGMGNFSRKKREAGPTRVGVQGG